MKKTLLALSLLLCLSLVACGSSPEDGSTVPEEPKPNTPQVETEQEHEVITKELIEETIRGLEFPAERKTIDGGSFQEFDAVEYFEPRVYKCWSDHKLNLHPTTINTVQTENLKYTIADSDDGEYFTVDCTAIVSGAILESQNIPTFVTTKPVNFSLVFSKYKDVKEVKFPEVKSLIVPINKVDLTNLKQYFIDDEYYYWDTNVIEKRTSGGVGFDFDREKFKTEDITNIEVVKMEFDDPEMSVVALHVIIEVGSQKFQAEIQLDSFLDKWELYIYSAPFLLKEEAI